MTDRDRLIELMKHGENKTPCADNEDIDCTGVSCEDCVRGSIADYLLANGVIVPPCKIGDTVYYLASECDGCENEEYYCHRDCKKPKGLTKVNSTTIEQFRIYGNKFDGMTDTRALASTYSHDFYFRDIGKTVFLTKEEAERALKELNNIIMTCNDCLHFTVCEALEQGNGIKKVHPIQCGCFKDKTDVVKVVRCKDCKSCFINNFGNEGNVGICNKRGVVGSVVQLDDFCSYGELKEREGK